MIALSSRNNRLPEMPLREPRESFVARVTRNIQLPKPLRNTHVLVSPTLVGITPTQWQLVLLSRTSEPELNIPNTWHLAPELSYLDEGDVIKVVPERAHIRVLYRRQANAPFFLVTERCNSYCLMCSQPPRDVEDRYLVTDMLAALPLLDPAPRELGITGGEPTLLGDDLIRVLQACKQHLPRTGLHMLSNGRRFQDLAFAKQLAQVAHPDLMVGIPLYADYSQLHDFIVQADGAFDETVRGILNLKQHRQKVEIRVVIHRQNAQRLPRIAEFLARNLLFVDQVALMGLELAGFAKTNIDALWIDPNEYRSDLTQAVQTLAWYGMKVSIYNHPLCLLEDKAHPYAVRSISDWKNEYMPECTSCARRQECGGFFSSSKLRYSKRLTPFP